MFASTRQRARAAIRLHRYMVASHWTGQALIGPDCGIRFNYRIGRFIKSALPRMPWNDGYYYLQAQGYWTLGNWRLFEATGDNTYREMAVRTSASMLAAQRANGAWDYPNPEWRGRIATAEGTWGSLGLLESFRQTGDRRFLAGALRWHRFLIHAIGFQRIDDELAVNYFAHRDGPRVPNNSALALRFLAELADATGDHAYTQPCAGLLAFMERVQKANGELPYTVGGAHGGRSRPHFQCYQYNAFQCLDLMRFHGLAGDRSSLGLITRVLGFLRTGLAEDGRAFYECGNRHRQVTYHAAALAAAFREAGPLGLGGYDELAGRAYAYVLQRQRPNGALPHSRGDYYLLSDQRSYPRNLSMILYHFLSGAERAVG